MHCQRDDSGFAHMDVSENGGTPKSSILIGFSIIFTIHFGGNAPIFGNIHMCFAINICPLPEVRFCYMPAFKSDSPMLFLRIRRGGW